MFGPSIFSAQQVILDFPSLLGWMIFLISLRSKENITKVVILAMLKKVIKNRNNLSFIFNIKLWEYKRFFQKGMQGKEAEGEDNIFWVTGHVDLLL